ncbi:MAG: hypothetical protein DWQ01_04935 [Planctomycetota bacterium]|nr:MAG: hypothetical protein DWQ01_04935 [Planctomycetota bacterium]
MEFVYCSTEADEANSKLFGWSFIPRNDNTGPWLSKGGTQAAGIDNSFVWFDQFGALVGCFWFGGTPYANFAMKLFGGAGNCRIYWDCAGLNDLYLMPSAGFPNFTWHLLNPNAPGVGSDEYWLLISLSTNELVLPSGTLLVNHLPLAVPPIPFGPGNSSLTLDVTAASGLTICTQAVCVPAGSGPPGAGNIPVRWSNGECDDIP